MPTEAETIAKGKSDYYTLKSVYTTPYPMASQEYNHYERDWTQSLKFDGGKLIEISNKPTRRLLQRKHWNTTHMQNRRDEANLGDASWLGSLHSFSPCWRP